LQIAQLRPALKTLEKEVEETEAEKLVIDHSIKHCGETKNAAQEVYDLITLEFEGRYQAVLRLKTALFRVKSVVANSQDCTDQLSRCETQLKKADSQPVLVEQLNRIDEMRQQIVRFALLRSALDQASRDKFREISACRVKLEGLVALSASITYPDSGGAPLNEECEMKLAVQALLDAEHSIRELAIKVEIQENTEQTAKQLSAA
jgi:hypothetical protein